MFGAIVVAPLIMGFDPNLAILFSGIGTLIFFVVVGGYVPSYLGWSFAFIGPVGAVAGSTATGTFNGADIPKALGGIVAAGLIYTAIGVAVQTASAGWIDKLMPPLVTGAVVAIIGLNLAGPAKGLATADPFLAILTILSIFVVGLYSGGLLARLPILLGAVIGYLGALILGGTLIEGRSYGLLDVHGIDFTPVRGPPGSACPTSSRPRSTGGRSP